MPAPKDPKKREEWIENIRIALTGKKNTAEHNAKISAALSGKSKSAEHCANIKKNHKGMEGRHHSAATIKKMSVAKVGKKRKLFSAEHCANLTSARKKLWLDSIWREKQIEAIFKGLNIKPNKPEKQLNKLLQKLFPNEYKFVGDGKDKDFIIAGKSPDFININGQKKIIEHFGDFHHGEGRTGIPNEQHEQERVDLFAQYGWETLIIWQHELKNIDMLEKKILEFNNE